MIAANEEITDLLEKLQSLSGCAFLSDLHTEGYRSALLSALNAIDPDAYSLQTWNYAASYISMEPCAFSGVSEACNWLTAYLMAEP